MKKKNGTGKLKKRRLKGIFSAVLSLSLMIATCMTGVWFFFCNVSKRAEAAEHIPQNPTWNTKTTVDNPVWIGKDVTWDCVYFGSYWQKDTNGDGKADEKDEKTPIKWRVLSVNSSSMLLLADQNLDWKKYNETEKEIKWENCTLRSWLNGYNAASNEDGIDYSSDNFIGQAFSSEEQSVIQKTSVINEDNTNSGVAGGNDTKDKIYLLSISEVCRASYGFLEEFHEESETREAKSTSYAKEKSGLDYFYNCWLLRSSGTCETDVASVFDDGTGLGFSYGDGWGYNNPGGVIEGDSVRPAISIPLSSSLWSYAGTVSSDGTDGKISTWDCVYFGHYWQEDTNGDGTADEKDEKQPIKWRVLSVDESSMFLIADKNLDIKPYNQTYTEVTWESSTLRSWLNGYGAENNKNGLDYSSESFIGQAFSSEEQEGVQRTSVTNKTKNTEDKIYLLSDSEISSTDYGFYDNLRKFSKTRGAENTDYVNKYSNIVTYWLRSQNNSSEAVCVISNENVGNDGFWNAAVNQYDIAVRPALHLSLSSPFWSYAGTVSSGTVDEKKSGSGENDGTGTADEGKSGDEEKDSSLTKGQIFAKGNFKYKVTKVVPENSSKTGKVTVVGLSKKGKNASKITVPSNITYEKQDFQVTKLGEKVFKGAKATAISLPSTVTEIPSAAFVNCTKLEKLKLGKINHVAKGAFMGCKKVITIGGKKIYKEQNLKKLKKSGYKKFK
ncbi:MAG: leucine-rich repeat protein [Lachnospiraceae bacterium]|nr:leucine-rich repeat protein [Lachnospiraceae bacterium]